MYLKINSDILILFNFSSFPVIHPLFLPKYNAFFTYGHQKAKIQTDLSFLLYIAK